MLFAVAELLVFLAVHPTKPGGNNAANRSRLVASFSLLCLMFCCCVILFFTRFLICELAERNPHQKSYQLMGPRMKFTQTFDLDRSVHRIFTAVKMSKILLRFANHPLLLCRHRFELQVPQKM